MKYSLRSLMMVVTVAALFIGLWAENWRTCTVRAREYAQLADQLDEKGLAEVQRLMTTRSGSWLIAPKLIQERQQQVLAHRSLAAEYRQAIWQPWKRWWIEELPPQDAKP
ncbi:MAG TPA: hypothetical protein VFB96_06570 [Pirellulaceae bacterium]|nr:hypothetical protein [Pirellulaceae bacterium]